MMRDNMKHSISVSTKETFIWMSKKLASVTASRVISGIREANMDVGKH